MQHPQPTPDQLNKLVTNVQAHVQQELRSEEFLGLDEIPIHFETPQDLINFLTNLQFLDTNLEPLSNRVDKISEENPTGILQLNRELWVANRLFTIQKYKQMDGYYKGHFKRTIIKGERAEQPLGIIPRLGFHLNEYDWDVYEAVFDQLFQLEPIPQSN